MFMGITKGPWVFSNWVKAFHVLSHLTLTMPHRANSYHYPTLEAWRLGLRG